MRIMRPSISSMTASVIGFERERSARSLQASSQRSIHRVAAGADRDEPRFFARESAGSGSFFSARAGSVLDRLHPDAERERGMLLVRTGRRRVALKFSTQGGPH